MAAHLRSSGREVRLVELGPAWPGPLPFPRVHLPPPGREGEAPRLEPAELRGLLRRLLRAEELVVHLPGRDGPLVRALALASRRALLVPPPGGLPDSHSAELLRACLDASHRLRMGWVARERAAPVDSPRVESLPPPGALVPGRLPRGWGRWLEREEGEAAPLLVPPLAALRLLPGPGP